MSYIRSGIRKSTFKGLGGYGGFGSSTLNPTHEKKRYFHLNAEKLHQESQEVKASSSLYDSRAKRIYIAAAALRDEIAPYHDKGHRSGGWEGCARPGLFEAASMLIPVFGATVAAGVALTKCAFRPYLSKHEITERLREAITLSSQKMSNVERATVGMGYITPETREARITGIEAGIIESEESRGASSIGKVMCKLPGIDKACDFMDKVPDYKWLIILGIVAVTGLAVTVVIVPFLHPYMIMAAEASKRVPG